MARIGSYHEGERVEGLPEAHFGFAEAAARTAAGSHTSATDSAAIKQRDSENTVNIRPNRYATVAAKPFA